MLQSGRQLKCFINWVKMWFDDVTNVRTKKLYGQFGKCWKLATRQCLDITDDEQSRLLVAISKLLRLADW